MNFHISIHRRGRRWIALFSLFFVLVLSIAVLVLDSGPILWKCLGNGIVSRYKLCQHPHDPSQDRLAGEILLGDDSVTYRKISWIAAHSNAEPRAISKKRLRSSSYVCHFLPDVQRNRLSGAKPLVACMTLGSRKTSRERIGKGNVVYRQPVDVELFVIENWFVHHTSFRREHRYTEHEQEEKGIENMSSMSELVLKHSY